MYLEPREFLSQSLLNSTFRDLIVIFFPTNASNHFQESQNIQKQ